MKLEEEEEEHKKKEKRTWGRTGPRWPREAPYRVWPGKNRLAMAKGSSARGWPKEEPQSPGAGELPAALGYKVQLSDMANDSQKLDQPGMPIGGSLPRTALRQNPERVDGPPSMGRIRGERGDGASAQKGRRGEEKEKKKSAGEGGKAPPRPDGGGGSELGVRASNPLGDDRTFLDACHRHRRGYPCQRASAPARLLLPASCKKSKGQRGGRAELPLREASPTESRLRPPCVAAGRPTATPDHVVTTDLALSEPAGESQRRERAKVPLSRTFCCIGDAYRSPPGN